VIVVLGVVGFIISVMLLRQETIDMRVSVVCRYPLTSSVVAFKEPVEDLIVVRYCLLRILGSSVTPFTVVPLARRALALRVSGPFLFIQKLQYGCLNM
jgi:hypothetical protein